jgi:hemoglobin
MKGESFGPGAAAGVTEPMIIEVVHALYRRVRKDPTLGPIFLRVIGEHWDAHLAKMRDFWSSALLMSGRYHGTPMAAHVRIGGLGPQHFALWLRMFRETAIELCPQPAAELLVAKSQMIARSLQLAIASQRGESPPVRPATRNGP